MADYTILETLVSSALDELARLNYAQTTVTGFRRMYNTFLKYAGVCGTDRFTEQLAIDFINDKFDVGLEHLYQSNPSGPYLKNWLRAMRILMEFDECG